MAYPSEWFDDDALGFEVVVPVDDARAAVEKSLQRVVPRSRLNHFPGVHIDIGSAEMACARQYKGRQITVSATLVHLLSQEELDGVVAHEVAHLELLHGLLVLPTADMLPPGLLQKVGSLIYAGTAGMSRAMEIAADIRAAHLCGSPQPLMSALRKVCSDESPVNIFDLLGRSHPSLRTRLAILSNCPERQMSFPASALQ